MSKELIERLLHRASCNAGFDDGDAFKEAADLIEQQQKLIEEQALQVLSAQAQAQENYEQLAAAQKRIELYEQALKASWPEGAMGDAFDYWNAVRRVDV